VQISVHATLDNAAASATRIEHESNIVLTAHRRAFVRAVEHDRTIWTFEDIA
jgi:hypothetical protein